MNNKTTRWAVGLASAFVSVVATILSQEKEKEKEKGKGKRKKENGKGKREKGEPLHFSHRFFRFFNEISYLFRNLCYIEK
ncbi:hypothetical protein T492DRAFT_552025 [Pavlovales sp. CCMP2436]|nr:hypothetical protein T492DRAFT_552025 [Pavlovales sp. CCMP2436]